MTKIFNFIVWWWRRLDTWQKGWMAAAFVFGAGLSSSEPYKIYLLSVLPAFILLSMLKWAFWDSIKDEWIRYNKEQEEIVRTLKDGAK
jgi:hypothetical protein